ncbi:anthrone oxygenase family protein [Streptomyces geranii]|uniref:anthrone oxygenase family protein n=1 Tax=Streptomyces geranii TaxID=2058923 RepID=UPI001E543DE1|nr:anthrone oxygenase family protein [Streptomyces geranii]
MVEPVQVLMPAALLAGGLAAGGLAISVLAAPLFTTLPTGMYVPVHKGLVTRFDPFMPLSLLSCLLCDLALTATGPGTAVRLLAALGALLLAAAMTVSLTKNVPINRWLSTLDPAHLPADFDRLDPRERWIRWNRVRGALAVAALLANVGAAAVLI